MKVSTLRKARYLGAGIVRLCRKVVRSAAVIAAGCLLMAGGAMVFEPEDHTRWRSRVDAIINAWKPPFPKPENDLVALVCGGIELFAPVQAKSEAELGTPPDRLRTWAEKHCAGTVTQ